MDSQRRRNPLLLQNHYNKKTAAVTHRAPASSLRPHRHGRSIVSASAQAMSDSGVDIVPKILELIQGTDRGANATALPLPRRLELYNHLNTLEDKGAEEDYFAEDGHGLGMFEVSFVGESKASKEVNQTASSQAGGYVLHLVFYAILLLSSDAVVMEKIECAKQTNTHMQKTLLFISYHSCGAVCIHTSTVHTCS